MAGNNSSDVDDDFMAGPVNRSRIIIQTCLLVALLVLGLICQGTMVLLFVRFKSLRCLSNYLLIDLTVVEFLDITVNIPLFMQYFLFIKKTELSKQTRWYTMLFHRFFLLNDLLTQLALIIDLFLGIKFGKRFTPKKSTINISGFIIVKWAAILGMLVAFSKKEYTAAQEFVTEEAYQRVLFGPNQTIWKVVIPSSLGLSIVFFLMTNRLIRKSRFEVAKRHGMRVFGKGSRNSSKAITTLLLIIVVQTLSRIPATAYSYFATDHRIEYNRWFAFFSYFFLFLSSSILPVIYYSRTKAFKRALKQMKKHPFGNNAYLDYAARHGLKQHRNGRSFAGPRGDKEVPKKNNQQGQGNYTPTEQTKDTEVSSKTLSRHSLQSILSQELFPDVMTRRSFFSRKEPVDDLGSKELLHKTKERDSSRRCFSDSKMFEIRKLQTVKTSNSLLSHEDLEYECFSEDDMVINYVIYSDGGPHTQIRERFEIQKEYEENKTSVLKECDLDNNSSADKEVQLTSPKMKERSETEEYSKPGYASCYEKAERSEDGMNAIHSGLKTDALGENENESGDPDVFDTKL